MEKKKPSILKSLGVGLAAIIVILIFAYGVQVTDVNFETTRSEDRLTQLRRVLRLLARPDILEYETIETEIEVPFYLPCPTGQEITLPEPDTEAPYLVPSVSCGSPEETISIEGFNFAPDSRGPIDFITASGVKKNLGSYQTDSTGYFKIKVELPIRQPVAEAQHIRATTSVRVGNPMLTRTASATWSKIIETVFIALLATTIGTILSIPISFIAARNLMVTSKSSIASAALSIIGWPMGIWLGIFVSGVVRDLISPLLAGYLIPLLGVILGTFLVVFLVLSGIRLGGTKLNHLWMKSARILIFAAAVLISIAVFVFLSDLSRTVGSALIEPLGSFGFLANFLLQIGETARMLTPVIAAAIGGGVLGSTLGKIGQTISDKSRAGVVKVVNVVVAGLAGAILFALLGALVDWFYQIHDLSRTLFLPSGIGAALGIILALILAPKNSLPSGLVIYFITRTILNATRSVEPLVMAIVFVIWVGIGPFAGSLALALHTIAALAKLYSEQVESILPGPLEAIQATGANRLQTIVYAVIPQIVPPYISFTMYRWDINVRMSTIIGFVGGGGIGFLLQQNINLLNYRAASVQMLAIAVVVAIMDYVSSQIREKLV
jgi:phosphonate ABC transporter permease subunit PhnE